MNKDLTVDFDDAHAIAPGPRLTHPSPCFHCRNGNGGKCTGVSCWRCECGCRTRRAGVPAGAPEGAEHGAPSNLRTARR